MNQALVEASWRQTLDGFDAHPVIAYCMKCGPGRCGLAYYR